MVLVHFEMRTVVCLSLPLQGTLCRSLTGHGHWVNTLSLHTDYALRTGAYDPGNPSLQHRGLEGMTGVWVWLVSVVIVIEVSVCFVAEELQSRALERYKAAKVGSCCVCVCVC